ncbi:MAG: hypothetical protein ISS78_02385 [Phycisphaerae bacterium]|nr:hypothetical protein [Phycisphaerae bacterium]
MLGDKRVETPAFIYDEGRILRAVKDLARLGARAGCKALFTLKPLTIVDTMRLMVPHVDGFAASSLFEATLAREVIGDKGTVHITTPGFRPAEIVRIAELCDYIAFNSLSQLSRFKDEVAGRARCGLRINPRLSFVEDDRYNPCGDHSKLGVPLDELMAATGGGAALPDGITGLHFHTNADSETFEPLLATVRRIDAHLSGMLEKAQWVNLGGGYLFGQAADSGPFEQATELLRSKYAVEVFVEPGAGVVREAGSIVATVIDMFDSGGKTIAVLDTTVNHMPEIFEYQFRPKVEGEVEGGPHNYVLAGCSCLAGDVFGDFAFAEPLEVGRRVVFVDAGAYTMVKWHWFNGINLPAIYALTESGDLVLKKRSAYEDFAARCGAIADVTP